MNVRAGGARRGAHRSGRDLAGAFVPSLLAVLAVTSMITAVYVWRGEEPDTTVRANASTVTTAPMSSPSPNTSTPPASGSPAPAATSAVPSTPATSASAAVGTIEVVVLNQTSRRGLAAAAAQRLRDKGWTVVLTGNFNGVVPATTVYYPAGAEAKAQAAAAGLPTEARVRPRFGNLSTTRLTVVVTDNYPT